MPAGEPFQVSYSGQVRAEVKQILSRAQKAGKLDRIVGVLSEIDERLRTDPLGHAFSDRWKSHSTSVSLDRSKLISELMKNCVLSTFASLRKFNENDRILGMRTDLAEEVDAAEHLKPQESP